MAALAVWFVISWLATGRDPAGLALIARTVPYAMLYAGLRILLSIRDGRQFPYSFAWIVLVALCVWGVTEAACGLWQAIGRGVSRHALYAMTGHFSNPGPFGGFIACIMAVAFAWVYPSLREKPNGSSIKKVTEGIALIALAVGMLVLPASMSRAAWLGLAVAVTVTLLGDDGARSWVRRHRFVIPLGAVVVAALMAGAFLLKRDSAVGRLHIWDIEARAVMTRPLFGAGPGLGLGAYGDAQAAFFRDRLPDPATADSNDSLFSRLPALLRTRVQAAGCPEYPFNEFLGIGMETGLPGLLLALSAAVLALLSLFRHKNPFAAGLLCWVVFALASYPLSIPQLCILLVVFLAESASPYEKRNFRSETCASSQSEPKTAGITILSALLGLVLCVMSWQLGESGSGRRSVWPEALRAKSTELQRSVDYRRLYADGHALFQAGRFAESLELLRLGALLSSDPMFDIIIGRDYEALGDFDKARDAYLRAHYMVPGRLYPLVRLMRLQVRAGQDAQALHTARTLLDLPVNPRHRTMQRLHDEALATRDSLAALIDIYDYEGRE
ncbi:MAG: O-antigen ligase family protein [Bacteroidales bacterium]|nr:O-antigen ligase family protein [Bacteroidales bacterium]